QELGDYQTLFVAAGDVNGDGYIDFVEANGDNKNNRVYLNDGTGAFTQTGQKLTKIRTTSVALGDVDGDGDLDLIEATVSGTNLRLNDGSGNFTASVTSLSSRETYAVVLADIDGDGDLDLIEGHYQEDNPAPNHILLNDGSGNFADYLQFGFTGQTHALAAGDVDGDGDLDIFEGSYYGIPNKLWLNAFVDLGDAPSSFGTTLLNDGARHGDSSLTLGASVDLEIDGQPSAGADGDGSDDDGVTFGALRVGQTDATVTVNVQGGSGKLDAWIDFNGDGTFQDGAEHVIFSTAVSVGDNDVTFDIPGWALPGSTYARFRLSSVGGIGPIGSILDGEVEDYVVTLAAPTGSSGALVDSGQTFDTNDGTLGTAFADLDGDGDLDVITGSPGAIRVYFNDGAGHFTDSMQLLVSENTYAIAAGDLDGDGDIDFVAGNDGQKSRIYFNDGTGYFTTSTTLFNVDDTVEVLLPDIDGDGDLDYMVINHGGSSWVYFNDGSGGYNNRVYVGFGSGETRGAAVGDVDNDGDLDIIEARDGGFANAVLLNDGLSNFSSSASLSTDLTRDVALGDVNGDGFLDLIEATVNGLVLRLNDGTGDFSTGSTSLDSNATYTAVLVDIDGDGDLDIVEGNYSAANRVLFNDGSGSFTDSGQTLGTSATFALAVGDVDGDGDIDVFEGAYGQPNTLWLNVLTTEYDWNGVDTLTILMSADAVVSVDEAAGTVRFTSSNGFLPIGTVAPTIGAGYIEFAAADIATSLVFNNDNVSFATSEASLNGVSFDSGTVTSGTITITLANSVGDTDADDIVFNGGAISSGGAVTISTELGDVTSPGAATTDITASSLAITATSGVGVTDAIQTAVGNFEASTDTGGVFVDNTGDLTLGGVDATLTGVDTITSGDIIVTAVGYVVLDEDSAAAAGGGVSFIATDYVRINSTLITAGGDIVLNSDSDEDLAGWIRVQAAVTSNGGDITLGGGADPLTTPAWGGPGQTDGINFTASGSLSSDSGDISLRGHGRNGTNNLAQGLNLNGDIVTTSGNVSLWGQGGDSASTNNGEGVLLDSGATVRSDTGDIDVTGFGGGGARSNHYGVNLQDKSTIQVGAGDLTISATGGSNDSPGFRLSPASSGKLISTGSGSITVTGIGNGGEPGILIGDNQTIVGGSLATGDITFITDDFNAGGATIQSTGNLYVIPYTASTSIGIGGGSGSLNISDGEINLFQDGFASITIGDTAGGTGTVNINTATFRDPVTIAGGTILDAASGTDVSAPSITLIGDVAPGVLVVSGDLTLDDDDTLSIEIGGTTPGSASTDYDQVAVAGGVTIGANVALNLSAKSPFVPTGGETYTILDNDGVDPIVGTFSGLAEGAYILSFLGTNMVAQITYQGGSGNDVVLTAFGVDFGDAPSPYETTAAEDGARHLDAGPMLGANRDSELDGTHSTDADYDDLNGATPDDEDGVVFGILPFTTGSSRTGTVAIDLESPDGAGNYLDAWIDFNNDGDWDDAGEHIFAAYDLGTSAGVQTLSFTIPAGVAAGDRYARFRVSTTGGLLSTGLALDGEVEDHLAVFENVAPPAPVDVDATANSITESATIGTLVGITASSIDLNGDTITYSLADDAGGRFQIDGLTGVVTVSNAGLLDYETSSSHDITVRASDGALYSDSIFTIAVTNVSPSTPVDRDATSNGVVEGAATGTPVGVTAYSIDPSGPAVMYSLTDDAGGRFQVDGATGVVTVLDGTLLDYETATSHDITVQASDGAGGTSTQTFTIAVDNVAPSTPIDADASANAIAEGAAMGTPVGVTASSMDPNGPAVMYTLTDDAGGRFQIDGATGVVTVLDGSLIDFDAEDSHDIVVRASDPAGLYDEMSFTIAVTNVAPSTPTDTNGAVNAVSEGSPNGVSVGLTASSSDPSGGTINYTLVDDAGGRFKINRSTGVVSVARGTLIDFETATSHVITVRATDGGGLFSEASFVIDVLNVAPSAPNDANSTANRVVEGAASGTSVGLTASSSDPSGGPIVFTLVNDAGGRFQVDSATGVVTVLDGSLLDYETATSHSVTVRASDPAGLYHDTTFSIAVLNVAPSSPVDADAADNRVAEGATAGTPVGITASATDPGGGTLTYTLPNNAGGRFQIDGVTGVITVLNGSLLNFESASSHTIVARAADPAGLYRDATFVVSLDNVAPSAPADVDGATNAVYEDASFGTSVGIKASSSDPSGGTITYSLTDDAGGRFRINSSTGDVSVANGSLLDYESATTHNIVVRAADPAGLFNETAFTVEVLNVSPSAVTDGDYTANSVAEGAATGTPVGVTATSSDPAGGTIVYTLVDDAGDRFQIDAATGVVSVLDGSLLDFDTATSHNVTVRASDPAGLYREATFAIAVSNVAPSAPVDAEADVNSVPEGAANGTLVGITAMAVDPSGGAVAYSLSSNAGGRFQIDPTTGVVSVRGGSLLDYETATSHTIRVRATDTSGLYSDAMFVINITNIAPVAVDDASVVAEDHTLYGVSVLANDSDAPSGSPQKIQASLVGDVAHGALTLASNGSFTYTPDADFNGVDSFTYRAVDAGGAASNLATVTITVGSVNDAPVAVADAFAIDEDQTLAGVSVLDNDSDVHGGAPSENNTPLVVSLIDDATRGTLWLNADGTFTYTPDADFNGVDRFTYRVTDSLGGVSDEAVVTITITGQNDPPIVVDDAYVVPEDGAIAGLSVLTNDSDHHGGAPGESNTPLTVQLVSGPSHGVLVLDPSGVFSYTPDADFNGVDSFTYRAIDSLGAASDVATATFAVLSINDTPAPVDDMFVTDEDTALVGDVFNGESDLHGGAPSENNLPLTAQLLAGPSHGVLTLNTDGTFTYSPDADYNGADVFTYRTIDSLGGASAPATAMVLVNSINDAPVAANDAAATDEDTVVTGNVLLNDTDLHGGAPDESNTPLSAQLVSGPAHGTLMLNADGAYTYTPDADYNGVDAFTYRAVDSLGGVSDAATVTVTVRARNDAPVAIDDTFSVDEDTPLVGASVLANDADVDSPALAASLVDGPDHGTLLFHGDGTFAYTPDTNFNGLDTFTYTVSDGLATSNVATVTVQVNPVNDAPMLVPDVVIGSPDGPTVIDVLANDSDPDGETPMIVDVTQPGAGSAVINPDGTITYTPGVGVAGVDRFTYTVRDAAGAERTSTVDVTTPIRFGDGIARRMIFTDTDGTRVVMTLFGAVGLVTPGEPGVTVEIRRGTMYLTRDGGVSVDGLWIDPSSRDGRLLVQARGGDGVLSIHDVSIGDTFGAVIAAQLRVTGDIDVDGGLDMLVLGDISGGDQQIVTIGADATDPRGSLVFRAGIVVNASVYSDTPLALLQVTSWIDTGDAPDEIVTPWIGRLLSTGNGRAGTAGDFGADLRLVGPTGTQPALGYAMVRGILHDARWMIGGAATSIVAGQIDRVSFDLNGRLNQIRSGNAMGVAIDAESLGLLSVRGDLIDATIDVLTDADRVQVTGEFGNARLRAGGDIGLAYLGAMRSAEVFAGVNAAVGGLPDSEADFNLLEPAGIGALRTGSFRDSNVAAASLGRIDLGSVTADNSGSPFGVATQSFGQITYRDGTTGVRLRNPLEVETTRFDEDFIVRIF
ncbi:MAG: tandem-95 repeat protein, partial [Phycisphaera sp.]|nr:tandem-95 repeat protein [Phycisphaera sp.]